MTALLPMISDTETPQASPLLPSKSTLPKSTKNSSQLRTTSDTSSVAPTVPPSVTISAPVISISNPTSGALISPPSPPRAAQHAINPLEAPTTPIRVSEAKPLDQSHLNAEINAPRSAASSPQPIKKFSDIQISPPAFRRTFTAPSTERLDAKAFDSKYGSLPKGAELSARDLQLEAEMDEFDREWALQQVCCAFDEWLDFNLVAN
jgi:hypothetical protein